ncbi:hypothetical protein EUGRSUZ_D01746 [Eucalyptus grandis]|uniref:Uncharacterized protein n=2 Tax=Eucalyptus grandis TaxID=71139 RepID=A0ACC3L627_EUCGR|nr:hypothetical protein EUGRSUZ_D01746 [Eucalyptus grandis]
MNVSNSHSRFIFFRDALKLSDGCILGPHPAHHAHAANRNLHELAGHIPELENPSISALAEQPSCFLLRHLHLHSHHHPLLSVDRIPAKSALFRIRSDLAATHLRLDFAQLVPGHKARRPGLVLSCSVAVFA